MARKIEIEIKIPDATGIGYEAARAAGGLKTAAAIEGAIREAEMRVAEATGHVVVIVSDDTVGKLARRYEELMRLYLTPLLGATVAVTWQREP